MKLKIILNWSLNARKKKIVKTQNTSRADIKMWISWRTISVGRTNKTSKHEANNSSLNCWRRTIISFTNFENKLKLAKTTFSTLCESWNL